MFKKRYLPILTAFLIYTWSVHSQTFPDTYFEARSGKLEYGFYVPENYERTKTYPLLMYLHGMGNNYSVYLDWYDHDFQTENPCFVYTPKTPVSWADWSGWWDQLTEPMTAALHVMDSLISVYSVDTNRLYVYGISMGGEGTFDLLHKFPDKFAAAMSVCGGGQPFWAENISKTPFWMFHGSADTINPPKLTEQVYNEQVNLGAWKMRYTCYPGYGHDIWNKAASEPSWHDWMFAHVRNDTACGMPTGVLQVTGKTIPNQQIQLSWNDIRNANRRADKIWYYKIYNTDGLLGTVEFDRTAFVFPVTIEVDTFRVSAVNYHFKESVPSNRVAYDNGSFRVGMREPYRAQPSQYQLGANYPNPFNPTTIIDFSLPKAERVSLKLFDIMGREVQILVNEFRPAGHHHITLDATHLNSSVYFYKMEAGAFRETRKLTLLQ